MKKTNLGLWTLALCVLLAGQVFAAQAEKATPTVTGQPSLQELQRSNQLTGMTISNPQGEKLGKIEDLVIDENGTVKYFILAHGGLLGIGNKLIPIPWKALKPGQEKNTLVVNIDKKTLEKAPNFDPKEWPKFTEPEWQKRIEVYYELPASHSESR